jgi:hypothetical protein
MFYATGIPGRARFAGATASSPKPEPEMEKQALRNQAEALQRELEAIKKRLSELETGPAAQRHDHSHCVR